MYCCRRCDHRYGGATEDTVQVDTAGKSGSDRDSARPLWTQAYDTTPSTKIYVSDLVDDVSTWLYVDGQLRVCSGGTMNVLVLLESYVYVPCVSRGCTKVQQ